MQKIQIVDTHTGGEPTRIVVSGVPDLGGGSLIDQRERFQREFDRYRAAIVNEPRGSDVLVGALLCKPTINECVAGVIFFNNVGYLNMCGHGTIGLGVALGHLGVITPGVWKLETPVGVVSFEYEAPNTVALENVPSYRYRKGVEVKLEDGSLATGDIAWGGNWFFLVQKHGLELTLGNVERLTEYSWSIRQALISQSITGEDGGEIDHVELFGSALDPGNQSRNFVLCPGKAYDS